MILKVAEAFKIIRSAQKCQSLLMNRKQIYVRWIDELESTDIISRGIVRKGTGGAIALSVFLEDYYALMIFEENHVIA